MKYQITSGKIAKPVKAVIYGPEGIGKSTLASKMPEAVFIDIEGGTNQLDAVRLATPTSWEMLLDEIADVRDHGAEFGCQTLVIDTVDAAERLCTKAVIASDQSKRSIEDWGYGKGYVLVKERFAPMLQLLDEVVDAGINVVLLGHAILSKVERPEETNSYDKWSMKLIDTKRVSNAALVKEWADMVLFLDYQVYVTVSDKTDKVKATGGKRIIKCSHGVTWDAKNRFGLPDEMPLDDASATQIALLFARGKPTSQAPAPTISGDMSTWPATMGALAQLMVQNGVTESELRAAVAATGNFSADTDPKDYPQGFVDYLVASWSGVMLKVAELRKDSAWNGEIPFN